MRKTWGLRLAIVGFVMMMLVILFDLHGVNVYATEPNSNKEATDVLQVTVPTEIRAVLMADGTVVTPQGLQIQNHENVPILMHAYTDTDYGHAVNYTLDVDGVRVLSRTDRVDSNSNSPLEFGGQTSKVMTINVFPLTREKHAVLMDEAANGVADIFRLDFRFSVKEKKAFAVYSADDNALVFYKRYDTPRNGDMFDGRRVTNVYENVERITNSTVPWISVKSNIRSVRFADEVQPTDTANWFKDFTNCTSFDLNNLNTSRVANMSSMFNNCRAMTELDLSMLSLGSVTNMGHMLYQCASLETIHFGSVDTSHVVYADNFLKDAVKLKTVNMSRLDFGSVQNMSGMFAGCNALEMIQTPRVIGRPRMDGITSKVFYDETNQYQKFPSGTFPTNITTSHTLVKERPYTISYDVTGGVMPSEYPTSYFSSVGVETLPTPTRPGFVFDGWYEMGDLSSITVTPIGSEWLAGFDENSYSTSSFSGYPTGSYTLQFAFDMPEDGVVSAIADYISYGGSSSVEIRNVRVNGQPSGSSVKKGRCEITIDIWYTNDYTRGEAVMLTVDAKTQSKTKISSIPVGTTGDKHLVAEWKPREVTPIKGFVRISPEAELTPDKTSASIVTNWEAPADAIMAVKSFEMASDVNGTNAEAFQVTDNVTKKPIWGKYLRKVMYDESGAYSGELDSGWVGPMTAEFFGTVDIIGTAVVHNRPSYEVNGPIFQSTQTGCENYHVIWEIADNDQGTNGMTHIGLTNGGYLEHEDVGKFIRVVVVARSPFSQYVTGQITSAWVEVKEGVSLNEVPMLEEPQVEENEEPMVEPEVVPDDRPQEEIPSESPEATIPEILPEGVLPEEEVPADDGSLEDTPETMQEELEVVPAVWTTTKPIQAIPLVEKQLPIVTKPKNYEDGGMWL